MTEAGFTVELSVLEPPTSVEEIKTMKINVVEEQSLAAFTTVYKKGEKIVLYYYDKKPEIPETPETPAENENNNTTTPSTDTPSSSQVTGTNQITGQQ